MPILPGDLLTENDLLLDGVTKINKGIKNASEALEIANEPITTEKLEANAVVTDKIADNTVTVRKVNFLKPGKNLFDKKKTLLNKYVDPNSGKLVDASGTDTSNLIAIESDTYYIKNVKGHVAFYATENDKDYISGIHESIALEKVSFKTPSNAKYLRFSIKKAEGFSTDSAQLERGTMSSSYQEYTEFVLEGNQFPNIKTDKIENQAVTAEKTNFFIVGKNIFNKDVIQNNRLVNANANGAVVNWEGSFASEKIYIEPGQSYVASTPINYAFYKEDDSFISGKNSAVKGEVLTAPIDTKYLRCSAQNQYKDTLQLEKGTTITNYESYHHVLDPKYITSTGPAKIEYWYKGKKLVTYGDSIVQGGLWQPYLIGKLGFATHINLGVGGTKISDDGGGTGFCTDNRVNTIPSDSEVIIIMGGTNDCGQNVPLGDLTYPFDTTKFKGALATTIRKVQERCPKALIVVTSLLSGRGTTPGANMTTPVVNNIGLTSEDYAKAAQEVCHFMSTEFIDVFGKTGINQFNRATYIGDAVHPNDAGGKAIARVVVNGLKNMEPIN